MGAILRRPDRFGLCCSSDAGRPAQRPDTHKTWMSPRQSGVLTLGERFDSLQTHMPNFHYKALTASGSETAGQLEAVDRASALRELISHGVSVLEIGERGVSAARAS